VLKNRVLMVYLLGLFIVAQSLLWEYARVQPGWRADRFIIWPWSVRGYETTQGLVLLGGALLLGAIAVLLSLGILKGTRLHGLLVAAAMIGYVVAASTLANARPTVLGGLGVLLLSVMAATALTNAMTALVGNRVRNRYRGLLRAVVWLGSLPVFIVFVIGPIFGGERRPTWLVVATVLALVASIMIVRPPAQIGSYRLLIVGTTALAAMALTSGASIRLTLQRLQFEQWEVAADRGEIQITSGVLLAWLGCLIAVMAATGLWAKHRDEIAARARARRQQEAARQSEEELAGVSG
jgi:hypothetical protein